MNSVKTLTDRILFLNQEHHNLIQDIKSIYAKGQTIFFTPHKEMGVKNVNQIEISGIIEQVDVFNHIEPSGRLKVAVKVNVKIDKNHVYWLMHHEANFRGGYQPESTFLTINALDAKLNIKLIQTENIVV